jgi:phosphate uptake regulator
MVILIYLQSFTPLMRRKVIRHGPSTLTVSLPLSWAKEHGVKKGDELQVDIHEDALLIRTDRPGTVPRRVSIDIDTYNRVGRSIVTGCYRQGVDEIRLSYKDESFINALHAVLRSETEGFEITRQERGVCTINHLLGVSQEEGLSTGIRRLWTLTLSIANDAHHALLNKDEATLRGIPDRDKSVNRFMNYCIRIMNTSRDMEDRKVILHAHLLHQLESIADDYKELCLSSLQEGLALDPKASASFITTNKFLEELSTLYYAPSKDRMERLYHATKVILVDLKKTMPLKNTALIAAYLLQINNKIRDLLATIVELHFLDQKITVPPKT